MARAGRTRRTRRLRKGWITAQLMKVLGPAQLTDLRAAPLPTAEDAATAASGQWHLRRGPDGRAYLVARGEQPPAPGEHPDPQPG